MERNWFTPNNFLHWQIDHRLVGDMQCLLLFFDNLLLSYFLNESSFVSFIAEFAILAELNNNVID